MSSRILKYLALLAFVLLIVAISSFWFTGPSFREKDVVIELEGPTQISAGADVTYVLKYQNNTRSTLHGMEFHFVYPEGSAVMIDDKVVEDYSEEFSVDELRPGEKGEKEFQAFIIGERGSIKVAKATVSFRAGSLSSVFEKNSTLSTTIVDSPISLTLVAPPSLVSGAGLQYILDYRNSLDEDVSDLLIEFDYPEGFVLKDSDPSPDSSNKIWKIDILKKGSGDRIVINGILNGQENENKIVSAKLKRKLSGDYVDYQKASAVTVISNPVLGIAMLVNSSKDYSASLGDRLSYSIDYSNNSNMNFSAMNLSVKLEGDMYDFNTLDTRGGYFDSSNKTIIWDSSTIPEFSNFVPGSRGNINFVINIKNSLSGSGASQERLVKSTAKFSTPNVPINFSGNELSVSSSVVTKISTQPTFNQSAYHNDPTAGSFGPFPLRVGEETSFTVHWLLTNPGNDIDNVEVSAKLPQGVVWDNNAIAKNGQPVPSYNPNSSIVTWSFPKLPYGTGTLADKYEAVFRIKVKPQSSQKGSAINLLDSGTFSGTDNFTKQAINITRGGITSDTIVDKPRQGSVQ